MLGIGPSLCSNVREEFWMLEQEFPKVMNLLGFISPFDLSKKGQD